MDIKCEAKGNVGVVELSGALNAVVASQVSDQVETWFLAESHLVNLIIDMAAVESMDSSGLGALIGIMKKATDKSVSMKIAALQNKTRMVFVITRSYKIFDIYDTVDEALRNC